MMVVVLPSVAADIWALAWEVVILLQRKETLAAPGPGPVSLLIVQASADVFLGVCSSAG